jgi:dUTP pyrophosphatase
MSYDKVLVNEVIERVKLAASGVPLTVEGPYTPEYATDGSSAFDLCYWDEANIVREIMPGQTIRLPTALRFQLLRGWELQVRPRSGLGTRGLQVMPGTIDSDYTGEVMVIVHNASGHPFLITHEDRIAQAVLSPVYRAALKQGKVIDNPTRGSNGFGSTGV